MLLCCYYDATMMLLFIFLPPPHPSVITEAKFNGCKFNLIFMASLCGLEYPEGGGKGGMMGGGQGNLMRFLRC